MWFSEKFLTNRTNNTFLEVDGYQIFRRDRDTRLGGGILVFCELQMEHG